MKYIPLDALVAEIKRRKREAENNCGGHKSCREHECDRCQVDKYEEYEEILKSLEVKEVDLEKEFFDWYHKENVTDYNASILYERYGTISKKLAKHFFELGLKAQKI